ncbi:hypothetical protein WJX72_007203 [[Myrmecia] bisecta]|uniref:DNA topoisomerase (ATP-hydrolyzing) n=1 Tax=[Myrmecia] bisecta TaxID=41462 RepID=A0AAW1PLL7_9CHLO
MEDAFGEVVWEDSQPAFPDFDDEHDDASELDQAESLDFDAAPQEVLFRIEDRIVQVLEALSEGRLPAIPLILEIVHQLVREGREATQRDIYYMVLCPPIFKTPRDVNEAIQDAVSLLRVPRPLLGITCASRGAVVGCLEFLEAPGQEWLACTSQRAIPGSCTAIRGFSFRTAASYVIVVEKDAIFQRLAEDLFFDLVPSIIITAKGMPDMATRVFLRCLHEAFPHLVVVGLVDWNPSGVAILNVYKHGSVRMELESARCAIPSLKWLGVRFDMLEDAADEVWQTLSDRDRSLIQGLQTGPLATNAAWMAELDLMDQTGRKAEIEALYTVTGFAGFTTALCQALDRQEYI